jgi:hypothetical protein
MKEPLIRTHMKPPFSEEAGEEQKSNGSSDLDFELPPSSKKRWFSKIQDKFKKYFFLKIDLHDKMYYDHDQSKKIHFR